MTHFHLYIPSGILPSIKIPKIKLQKKLFSFSIGRTRDSYNVTSSRPDNTKFVPTISTISLQVHENVDENIVENNPDHVIGDKQKNQINSNLAASCIHNQNNLQNILGASTGGGIILNIPLKANNARRAPAPRDMNHEKFTPCQRRFQQHENSITDYNKNVKFSKGTGPKQGDQDKTYYEDICCSKNMVKIAPPPRKRKSQSSRNSRDDVRAIGTTDISQPINQTLASDFNFISPDRWDFSCMNGVKRCHINPNNKSDPWMVNVDYRKLEKPPELVQKANSSSGSHTFEDEFVNGYRNIRNADEKRTTLKQQRTKSVNIFELGNTINVFDDFDEIFDSSKTLSKPEQCDSDRMTNKMISETHAVDVRTNKRNIERNSKTVSFESSDAYAKMKKEQINISKHNETVFLQNHGSENGFPTFEYSGNQNITVNHMLKQDFAENRMRSSSYAKRSDKWEMFENCAIVGNENLFAGEFRLERFWNNIERNVFLDEKCLTIVLDLLDSEWRTGNINGK